MIEKAETIKFKKIWFDQEKYIKLQKAKILDAVSNFWGWKLYLEVCWEFLNDDFASNFLPWFNPDSKKIIFSELSNQIEVLFCVKADDILNNIEINGQNIHDYLWQIARSIEKNLWVKSHIVINQIDVENMFDMVLDFEKEFQKKWYRVWERYKINWYPANIKNVLSENWLGNDDHIPLTKNLILVTWLSGAGKTSTCLGQIYLDHQIEIKSGYAKYKILPAWNLDIFHPVNLADNINLLENWNSISFDELHKKEYWMSSVINSDSIENFENIMAIVRQIVTHKNYMIKYKSPTDMIINCTWFAISNDEIISIACFNEIQRKIKYYEENLKEGENKIEILKICEEIENKCKQYCDQKKYNCDQKIC